MLALERQMQIYEFLAANKFATVEQLAALYFVGPASIRRDLKRLEAQRLIRRTHGGAMFLEGPSSEIPAAVRQKEQAGAKEVIGRLAAALVQDNDTIFLDSSTTVQAMVPALLEKKLTVLTNSLPVSLALSQSPEIAVYLCGGLVRHNEQSVTGALAAQFASEFAVQKLFFSCRAMSLDGELWDYSEPEAQLRRTLLERAGKSYFLCDHGKIGGSAFHHVCSCRRLTGLVTDRVPGDPLSSLLERAGVHLLTP